MLGLIVTVIAEGQLIAGKIRLERPLARGGMGAVWIAHHLKLDRAVAVKFMEPGLAASDTARARFEREARAAAQIQSAHVVEVHDYGVEGETPYIVMELLRGEDLAARLTKRGKLGLAEALRITQPICKALRRAHELGLVHRDLKPGNVFLARQDDDEIVKLLDFGIAKAVSPGTPQSGDVTRSGNLVGSPLYMSPEQIRKSKEVDHRSDLWSLGVILYQMLTGRTPFVEDEVGAVLVAICTDPIPKPSTLAPELGPEVDRFFDRALARDPAERFQNSRELYEALEALATKPAAEGKSAAVTKHDTTPAHETTDEIVKRPSPRKNEKNTAVALAETMAAPDGHGTLTMSPSGRTQDDEGSAPKHAQRRFAAAGLGALALGVLGWMFVGPHAPAQEARIDGPGSPTLPLPPPVTEPEAPAPPQPAPTPEAVPKTTPETLAEVETQKRAPTEAPVRGDKPVVPAKPATPKTGADGKPEPAPASTTNEDDELLGLSKPATTQPPR
ncbi:serine/threonine-protein kinase [Polyangium sp. y55x31]|uniref:serine/threonine-protein kinase n=1 Tax=Polyangium sp. y55x31 TaxID=3042688 RepID=UPI00248249B3|nr:serine/threonine-protein kinase [Polyangium sp. y55x31]MDI1478467.1 serine/threonine-protein kinase [Polyangium sp. y55x31]